jgi:uncharacterized protein YprB with RNaseH-like and TPR domain
MLENTFLHLPHIGPKTEIDLWRQCILTWDQLELHLDHWPSSRQNRTLMKSRLQESREHRGQAAYFHKFLPPSERWRLYKDFRHSCAFLDIETTGMTIYGHEITVIGLYDGRQTHHFINGHNMEEFEDAIDSYELLVTFNGSRFDLPFISGFFRNLQLRQAHIDLLHVVRRLGYRGGLKSIEPLFGIARSAEIQEMSGYEAVVLWHEYQQGNGESLRKLLLYNQADVVNLKTILDTAWERLCRELELAAGRLLSFKELNV